MSAAVQRTRLDRQALGLWLALLAYSLLSMQDATIKWLVAGLPVVQVMFVRSTIVMTGCIVGGGRPLLRRAIASPLAPLLLCRGAVTLAAWLCYFTAARSLPLAQLLTLYFTAPVVVVLLAAPVLKERVGPARWAAVGLGFTGTILAANPSGFSFSAPTVLVLVAAVLWAIGVILTRLIARREPSLVQMLYTNAFFFVGTGLGSLLVWQMPNRGQLMLLLQVAVLGGLGQLALFESARRAPASLTAPMEYTALLWAFLLGFAVWGDVPNQSVVTGAGLILAAGLLLVALERWGSAVTRAVAKTSS